MTKAAELAKIVDASGNVVTSGTVEPAGDTAAGDNAAIGFTSAEGIVITGQGSTNDVTIKNDADADVIEIPTGTTNVTVAGTLTATGFIIGSADINENDLESIDGITAGTVAASKAAIVDTNKDITGFRNITLTGELDAATLDISGNADIDGTLEADAMTLNGTAITATATLDTGISNNNVPKFTSGVADDDFLRVSGTAIEGRSASEVLSDIGASAVAGSSSIVTTGALNAGSITSGFGTIDTGSSTITTTGVGTFGSLDISGDIDVDGTTNLDVVDIDGAVDMASTLQVDGAITSSTGMTITTADNTTQMTLTSTDADASVGPVLDLYRNSSSPADGDRLGSMTFRGRNDNSQDVTYATFRAFASDVSDGSEDTEFEFTTILAGSEVARMTAVATATVFNEHSADIDFRVESNDDANMFFVDAGNNRIGVRKSAPDTAFHMGSGSDNHQMVLQGNTVQRLGLQLGTDSRVFLGAATGNHFRVSKQDAGALFDVNPSGNIILGQSGAGIHLGVTSATASNLLDDYEEGTWTPTLTGATSGTRAIDSGFKAVYTKVGNLVTAHMVAGIGGLTGSASGGARLGGLPFNYNGSNNEIMGKVHVTDVDLPSGIIECTLLSASSGTTNVCFFVNMFDNAGHGELGLSAFDGDSSLRIVVTYHAA